MSQHAVTPLTESDITPEMIWELDYESRIKVFQEHPDKIPDFLESEPLSNRHLNVFLLQVPFLVADLEDHFNSLSEFQSQDVKYVKEIEKKYPEIFEKGGYKNTSVPYLGVKFLAEDLLDYYGMTRYGNTSSFGWYIRRHMSKELLDKRVKSANKYWYNSQDHGSALHVLLRDWAIQKKA